MIRLRDVLADVEYAENGCWLYTGARNKEGYGVIYDPDRGHPIFVHRWAYWHYHGRIPDGHTIDHECHTRDLWCPGGRHDSHRRCFNPADLAAVTNLENVRRRNERGKRRALKPLDPAAFV